MKWWLNNLLGVHSPSAVALGKCNCRRCRRHRDNIRQAQKAYWSDLEWRAKGRP